MSTKSNSQTIGRPDAPDTRFDRQFSVILNHAATVFAEKGYEGASMRDLSRLTGMSLAGLYYYFDSKDKLLYHIQKHTFMTIVGRLRERLAKSSNPEERIRIFVLNHVEYAVENQKAMKVLSHEDDVLKDGYGAELAAIKREYYQICFQLVDELTKADRADQIKDGVTAVRGVSTRTAVMGLFGMMNWLYTWYKPPVDPTARVIARQMSDIFLQGVRGGESSPRRAFLQINDALKGPDGPPPKKRVRKRS